MLISRKIAAFRGAAIAGLLVPACLASGILVFATPALAAPPSAYDGGQATWSMGLGYLRYQRPYIGKDYWNRLIPLFNVDTRHFYVHGLDFGWRAWRHGRQSLTLVARPDALHYNASENPALAGMTTKLATVMGGARWGWRFSPHLSVTATALTDILRRNDGVTFGLGINSPWRFGHWFLRPTASLEWQSSNYVNYYFGVTQAEARPGRPAYTGRSTVNEKVGFSFGRPFGGHFSFLAGAYMTHFGSGVTGSPIVGHATTLSYLAGLYYHF